MIYDNKDGFPVSSVMADGVYIVHGIGSSSIRGIRKLIVKLEEAKASLYADGTVTEGAMEDTTIGDYFCCQVKMDRFGLRPYFFATPYIDVQGQEGETSIKPYISLLPLTKIFKASRKKIVAVIDIPREGELKESPFGIWSFFYKKDLFATFVRSLRGVGETVESIVEYGRTSLYEMAQLLLPHYKPSDKKMPVEEILISRGELRKVYESDALIPLGDLERQRLLFFSLLGLCAFSVYTLGRMSVDFTSSTMKLLDIKSKHAEISKEFAEKQQEESSLRTKVGNHQFIKYYFINQQMRNLIDLVPGTCKITAETPSSIKTPFPGCINDLKAKKVNYIINYDSGLIEIMKP